MRLKLKITMLVLALIITSCSGENPEITQPDPDPIIQPDPDPADQELEVTVSTFPKNYQFYARKTDNKGLVEISGTAEKDVESIIANVYKDGEFAFKKVIAAQSNFTFNVEIEALLMNYTIELLAKGKIGDEFLVKEANHITAGDVYVLHGQSNAWALDYDNKYNTEDLNTNAQWVRTIGAMHVYNSAAILPEAENTEWFLASGKAPTERVGKGMVGVLGLNIGLNLVETEKVPIAIINGAGGGGAISFYQKTEDNDLNSPYGRLQFRIENSGLKDNIKAFIWNQGENNAGDSTLDYKNALIKLYGALSTDFTFEKFYVIQTPPGCNSASGHASVREAQRQFAEENADINILTRQGFSPNPSQLDGNYFMSDGCHYHAHGYEVLANWISNLARFDFYGATVDYQAPNVISLYSESKTSIIIEFDKEVVIQPDLTINGVLYSAKNYLFAINGLRTSSISTLEVLPENKKIRITLSNQSISSGDRLTYVLMDNYPNTSKPFQGPWIIAANTGVGAVGFTQSIK